MAKRYIAIVKFMELAEATEEVDRYGKTTRTIPAKDRKLVDVVVDAETKTAAITRITKVLGVLLEDEEGN